jgi:ABC-type multidrug transport system fused ATPase/permease subunit
VSNLTEIRRRLDRLTQLSNSIREQFARLSGPEGQEMKKKAKEEGTKIGIGAGISFFGLMVAAVACVYINAVIILLVNIALDKLWLSALIVVGGFLIIGGVIIAIGAGMISSSSKELSKMTSDVTENIKKASEEMKVEVEELQKVAKQEAEERQKQMAEMMEAAKTVVPVVIGAYIGYRIVKKVVRSRREKKMILKEIKLMEDL